MQKLLHEQEHLSLQEHLIKVEIVFVVLQQCIFLEKSFLLGLNFEKGTIKWH